MNTAGRYTFYERINYLAQQGYYGQYILESYSKDEIDMLGQYISESRNELFTYSGLELVMKRYLIQNHEREILEKPQEMFMGLLCTWLYQNKSVSNGQRKSMIF